MCVCVCVCTVDWLPEERRWLRPARRLLGNVCVTGVTQARQIHRAAVTDTFLARADLQTHPLLTRTFKHPFCFLSLSLADALCLFLSRSVSDTKHAVSRRFSHPKSAERKAIDRPTSERHKSTQNPLFPGGNQFFLNAPLRK